MNEQDEKRRIEGMRRWNERKRQVLARFHIGDRVYYDNDRDDTGTILDLSPERVLIAWDGKETDWFSVATVDLYVRHEPDSEE